MGSEKKGSNHQFHVSVLVVFLLIIGSFYVFLPGGSLEVFAEEDQIISNTGDTESIEATNEVETGITGLSIGILSAPQVNTSAFINGNLTAENGTASDMVRVFLDDTIEYQIIVNNTDNGFNLVPNPVFSTKATMPIKINFINGSFETPVLPAGVDVGNYDTGVPGWASRPTNRIEIQHAPGFVGDNPQQFAPYTMDGGSQYAELNSDAVGTLYQICDTVPGMKIYYEFYHGARMYLAPPYVNTDVMNFYLRPEGATSGGLIRVCSDSAVRGTTYQWGHYTGEYVVPDGQTRTEFSYESVSSTSGLLTVGNYLDGIRLYSSSYIDLTKSNNAPGGRANVGDIITYTIFAENAGESDAKGVQVIDTLPAGLEFVDGSVMVDGIITSLYSYDQSTKALTVNIGAGATPTVGGLMRGYESFSLDCSRTHTITYRVRVTSDEIAMNYKYESQSMVSYIDRYDIYDDLYVNYSNVDEFALANPNAARVVDVLPTGLSYVSHTNPAGSTFNRSGQTCTWDWLDFPIGQTIVTVTARVTVSADTVFINNANYSSIIYDVDSNNTYHYYVKPYLVTEKYVDVEGNPLEPPVADTFVEVDAEDPVYSKAIPAITGYMTMGYFVGDFNPLTDTYTPGSSVNIDPVAGDTTVCFIYNNTFGFQFNKVDEKDQPMSGVSFSLYKCNATSQVGHDHSWDLGAGSCWQYEDSTASGSGGLVQFIDLKAGVYLLVETDTLPAYILPIGRWIITIDNLTFETNIESIAPDAESMPPAFKTVAGNRLLPNYLKPYLVTEKYVDVEGNPLEPPVADTFVEVDAEDPVYSKAIPAISGYMTMGYFIGDYNPLTDSYTLGSSISIDPLSGDTTVSFIYKNTINFLFAKVNENDVPMPGVSFSLYKCNATSQVGHTHSWDVGAGSCWQNPVTAVSGSGGLVQFTDLKAGVYLLVETDTLPAYILPTGRWIITIDGLTFETSVESVAPDAESMPPAFKTVAGNRLLPNYLKPYLVTEKYFDVEGNPLEPPVADTFVEVDAEDPVYSKAIPAISGYMTMGYFIGDFDPLTDDYTSGSSISIDPLLGDTTVSFIYKNTIDFLFAKVNENDVPMPGVSFSLYKCNATSQAGHTHSWDLGAGSCWQNPVTAVSGPGGLVQFTDLKAGVYLLVETDTLPAYILPTGRWIISIDGLTFETSVESVAPDPESMPPSFTTVAGNRLLPNYLKPYLVTEKYVDVEGNPLEPPVADTFVEVDAEDPVYSKAIPAISGYMTMGYFIGDFDPLTDDYTSGSSISIDPLSGDTTVSFIYKNTIDFRFTKVNEKDVPMPGVSFSLYKCNATSQVGHTHSWDLGAGSCWLNPVSTVSGPNGLVQFSDLKSGVYLLVETDTLPDYELPTGRWIITIDELTYEISIVSSAQSSATKPPSFKTVGDSLLLPNYKTYVFPQTGSTVTIILLGMALMDLTMAYMLISLRKQKKPRSKRLHMKTT
jgi:uncharacterized repeat protein (TIGR01451 family)